MLRQDRLLHRLEAEIEVSVEEDAIVAKAHAVLDTRLLVAASIQLHAGHRGGIGST